MSVECLRCLTQYYNAHLRVIIGKKIHIHIPLSHNDTSGQIFKFVWKKNHRGMGNSAVCNGIITMPTVINTQNITLIRVCVCLSICL
jgi:hypothetical protein